MANTPSREQDVASILVRLADTLEADFQLDDALAGLSHDCVRLLSVTSAGLLIADSRGLLRVVVASSEHAVALASAEIEVGEGPGIDAYRTGLQVGAVDLQERLERWPKLALLQQVTRAYALPMRLRQETVGALLLFGLEPAGLGDAVLRLGQALADMATITILRDRAMAATTELASQLQSALSSRVVLEQAKGVLAERNGVSIDDAFLALRKYARDHNQRLDIVSRAVIDRSVDPTSMLRAVTD